MLNNNNRSDMQSGDKMLSRDGMKTGSVITPYARKCTLEGCRSYRTSVRWEDGRITYPCMRAVKKISDGVYQIE